MTTPKLLVANRHVIYLRKSRADLEAEQYGEGETLARHEHILLELARKLHLDILDIYREIVSGDSIASRPMIQRLLSEVEAGQWDGVLVMEVERLARGDTIDQGLVAQAFQMSSTKIITPTKTYDPNNEFDQEYFEFGLFMSRREYKTINRRLQRGRLASVQEGKYIASRPPYGYQRKKLEMEKGFTLTPDPQQAPIVKMIFDWYVTGERQPDGSLERLGVSRIVRRLNDLRIAPLRGQDWTPASVRDILNNPVYIGKIRWNWRKRTKHKEDGVIVISRPRSSEEEYLIAEGRHEPIIDPAIFALAQEYRKNNPVPSVHEKSVLSNPLAGLVVCGKCNRKMQRRPYLKSGRTPALICPYTTCNNVSTDLVVVEARILKSLKKWLDDYRLRWGNQIETKTTGIAVHRQAIRKLDTEIQTLQKQQERLHDLLEQGIYDTDKFLERSRILAERRKQAIEDRAALATELALAEQREASQKDIIPKVEKLLAVYSTLPTAKAKNDMLKEVLEKVVYTKEKSGRWADPDDFQVILYPKIPYNQMDQISQSD